MVSLAIDSGLYPSKRRAAETIGMSLTECDLWLQLDRLPAPVKRRLSKLSLTPASAKRLVRQWEKSPDGTGDVPKALRVLYAPPAA